MAADLGVLQRLPKCTGNGSWLAEKAFLGDVFAGAEALQMDVVSKCFESGEQMWQEAWKFAEKVQEKSRVAVLGIKKSLRDGREKKVQEGLQRIAVWNAAMLQSKVQMET